MKILPTEFRGVKYRSRTEARWAVFFSALGVDAVYEPEGYELDDGTCYLPDFFIPAWDIYMEIKGKEPSIEEKRKCQSLCKGAHKPVLIMSGGPGGLGWLFTPNMKRKGIRCCFRACRKCERPVLMGYSNNDEVGEEDIEWWHWRELGFPKCAESACSDKNPVLCYGVKEAIERARTERFGIHE